MKRRCAGSGFLLVGWVSRLRWFDLLRGGGGYVGRPVLDEARCRCCGGALLSVDGGGMRPQILCQRTNRSPPKHSCDLLPSRVATDKWCRFSLCVADRGLPYLQLCGDSHRD